MKKLYDNFPPRSLLRLELWEVIAAYISSTTLAIDEEIAVRRLKTRHRRRKLDLAYRCLTRPVSRRF
jgi:hypothetical protein